MDCKIAQGLISDAVDRQPVDAAALAEAKAHCNGCAECSVFVRTLLVAKNVPAPAPPADLADRVMAKIRAEHESSQAAAATAAAAAAVASADEAAAAALSATSEDGSSASGAAGTARVGALRVWARGLSAQEAAIWISAAAVVIAVAGISAVSGIRILTAVPEVAKTASVTAAPTYGSVAATPEAAYDAGGASQLSQATTAGSYITIQDVVYLLSGPSSVATATLTPAGAVTSALGSGAAPASHEAYTSADPDVAYLVDDTGSLLEFKRVTRSYGGSTYQLTSAPLSDYGQWPTLPPTITPPTAEDGSPTFVSVPSVISGTALYRLASSNTDAGIAVGPGSDPSDPAAGNPNWTWWTKAP